jgi:hypothetical protein
MLLAMVLPALTHLFNFIFICSKFPCIWKCAVVLPIAKVSNPAGFSDFRPISLLLSLSKPGEVLMAGQMNGYIRNFELLCPFQSGLRRHHSITTAVLKVTEDIRSNLEDRQATVLTMLDLAQAFDMIAHDLLVCKMRASQRYSDGATAFLGSYLSDRTQCVGSDVNILRPRH